MVEIALYGAGLIYHRFIDNICKMANGYGLHIFGICDRNEQRILRGGGYLTPEELNADVVDYVILTVSDSTQSDICDELIKRGFARQNIISVFMIDALQYEWDIIKKFHEPLTKEEPYKEENIDISDYHIQCNDGVKDISFFSMHCAGGCLSHSLNMRFCSPMINMFFIQSDYIKLLRSPHLYMESIPRFLRMDYNRRNKLKAYPVYRLEDIELHMNHTADIAEGIQKWEERKKRILWNRIVVLAYTGNSAFLRLFDDLPYPNKICFIPFQSDLPSSFCIDMSQVREKELWDVVNRIALKQYPYYWDKLVERLQKI